jgi:hypothetical protein
MIVILPNVLHLAGVLPRPADADVTRRGQHHARAPNYVGKPAQTSGMTERCINEARL